MLRIELTEPVTPPAWALWERYLLDTLPRAARDFVARYTRPDGTLVWRESWPGMDGSDDAYEAFFNFPLLAALGGDMELHGVARYEWEAVTRQFTAYGQIHREFDAYYDWMHHGESSLLLYYLALSDPADARMAARAQRFAAMYTGEDPAAPNYDPQLRMMRSPINGSRGPRFENTYEDWITHLPVLADYPPPYDDIPGITRGNWTSEANFRRVLAVMNQRMMRGDVPLNLTATSLMTHAHILSGSPSLKAWVLDYLGAWVERARRNGGLLPDNIGPSGEIGELIDGRWWGGYYGWQWPHGMFTIVQPALIAGANALLLTSDSSWLHLARAQLDALEANGRSSGGHLEIPRKHGAQGWHAFVPATPELPVHLWHLTHDDGDAERVTRWTDPATLGTVRDHRGKGDDVHAGDWFRFVTGAQLDYPEAILRVNHAESSRRLAAIRADRADPAEVDIHHFQNRNPLVLEGLVQMTLGCPNTVYHGGLLHASVRHFDPVARRPGLPPGVAVLVDGVDRDGVDVRLVNLDALAEREVVIQGGTFGEHEISSVAVGQRSEPVGDRRLHIGLAPGAGGRLRLGLRRHALPPTYAHPWHHDAMTPAHQPVRVSVSGRASSLRSEIDGALMVGRDGPLRFGLGTAMLQDPETTEVLHRAVAEGFRYLDTSLYYGHSELVVGRFLREAQGAPPFVATKTDALGRVADWAPKDVERFVLDCFGKSLERLGVDQVDLYQLHDVDALNDERRRYAVDALQAILASGRAHHVGATGRDVAELEHAALSGAFESILTYYDYTPLRQDAAQLLQRGAAAGLAMVNASPVAFGLLSGDDPRTLRDRADAPAWQEDVHRATAFRDLCREFGVPVLAAALAYPLRNPDVAITLTGPFTAEQLQATVEAVHTSVDPALWEEWDRRLALIRTVSDA